MTSVPAIHSPRATTISGKDLKNTARGIAMTMARTHLLPDDHGRGCIVSYPINPDFQRASSFEVFEALPESDMNFPEKISPLIRIHFISAGETVESSATTGHCFSVEVVPRGPDIRHPLT
jgi:hypothetical protein